MEPFSGSNSILRPPRLFCALALLAVTGCALTPSAEGNPTPDPDAVDVGYGTVDKDHVTGSVATVRTEDEATINSNTLANMLAKVPGVRVIRGPGGQISVRIRGPNSLNAGQEPLFVVDGRVVPFAGGDLASMNPNSVESITVLKDAGSTAIYGSRGANGVILIKTKVGGGG